jgi:hypothetical protein
VTVFTEGFRCENVEAAVIGDGKWAGACPGIAVENIKKHLLRNQ